MDFLLNYIDFVLHIDRHLDGLIQTYGTWVYLILFAIIFCETGLVVLPFLPGDSLLFALGALGSIPGTPIHLGVAGGIMLAAAVAGDAVNYTIGARLGPAVFHSEGGRWLNKKHLQAAHEFYEKYGGKTIILARFVPIIRTFAPFVAGVAEMTRSKFTFFNVTGALIWVLGIVTAGYLFGNLPWVQANLSKIIWALILVPGLIALYGAWKAGRADRQAA